VNDQINIAHHRLDITNVRRDPLHPRLAPFQAQGIFDPPFHRYHLQERVVQDYIKYGLDAGFDLVTGGHKLSGDGYDHGYYVEPTIFAGVDNASRLGQEEIFGPVVTVTTFSDEREAVDLANAVDFGLVAGVWSTDYPRAMRVARRIRAGTVWIWDNYAQPVEGIWGGYKQSGMGRELGYHGLNDFMEVKQIFTDGTGLTMKPPYGQVMKE